MENKETINENSFLERVKVSAESAIKEVERYKHDKDRHRALVVLASDAEDDKPTKAHLVTCGDTGDIIILLYKLISFYPLSYQKTLIGLLQSCYEQRKNGK